MNPTALKRDLVQRLQAEFPAVDFEAVLSDGEPATEEQLVLVLGEALAEALMTGLVSDRR